MEKPGEAIASWDKRFAALLRAGHMRVTGPRGFDSYPDRDEPWILLRPVGRRALIENVGS